MRFAAMLAALALSACDTVVDGPDPRNDFSERNIGNTIVTYVDRLGSQVVHMSPSGDLFLWSSAQPGVQRGQWKYDILATGAATSYVGAGGINHPVQELETAWGICFQYVDAQGRIIRRQAGGDWNCALLQDYEALVIDRAPGDAFALRQGQAPGTIPPGERMTVAALRGV